MEFEKTLRKYEQMKPVIRVQVGARAGILHNKSCERALWLKQQVEIVK